MNRKTVVLFALGGLLGAALLGAFRRRRKERDGVVGRLTRHDLDADLEL